MSCFDFKKFYAVSNKKGSGDNKKLKKNEPLWKSENDSNK
jgi:hypothetical protein